MQSFADIIDLWPTATELAAELGEKEGTVRQWKNRNSIPADRWPAIVGASARRGFRQVTYEILAAIAAAKKAAA